MNTTTTAPVGNCLSAYDALACYAIWRMTDYAITADHALLISLEIEPDGSNEIELSPITRDHFQIAEKTGRHRQVALFGIVGETMDKLFPQLIRDVDSFRKVRFELHVKRDGQSQRLGVRQWAETSFRLRLNKGDLYVSSFGKRPSEMERE